MRGMLDNACETIRRIGAGEVSSVEVVEHSIGRIEDVAAMGIFVEFDAEAAMDAARDVDRRRRGGEPVGALAGLPVAVKDNICVAGRPTTCASRMLRNFVPPYDADVVRRIREADGIVVGKTNLDEFAMGASTETSVAGRCVNPWDPDRTPGGSSGGSAAAVAAGTVPWSVGSDTGGSIRQPAAFCGVTGIKPTYGRVSRRGLVAFASSLDQIGPMAWSVEDAALLLSVLAGFDSGDTTSLDAPMEDYVSAAEGGGDLKGVRVGVLRSSLDREGLSEDVRRAVAEAERVLKERGASVVEVTLPHEEYWVPTYYVIAPSEASSNLSRYDGAHYGFRESSAESEASLVDMYCRSRGEGFGAEVKRRIMIGTYALSAGYADQYYNQALKIRRLIHDDYAAAFGRCDVLLGPVTPTPAFPLGAKVDDPLEMYLCDLFTVGANLAGVPAMSLPGGFDAAGLPIGVHLQAPPLGESRLLSVGAAFQSVTDYHTRRVGATA